MDLNLKGYHALVCGSTQGIGRSAAHELALMGCRVTLVARNEEKLKVVLGELATPEGQEHGYVCADFDQPDYLEGAIGKYLAEKGPAEILIHNTGGPPGGPVADAGLPAFRQAFERHLICGQVLVQACLPGMKAKGYGRVVNVISTSVKAPIPGLGVSNTVRGAVANWAKTLSLELASYGITVNNVLPGFTRTGRLDAIIKNRSDKQGVGEGVVSEAMRKSVPAGRFGEAEEVGQAIAFLCSPSAGYINGINLPVDGGRTASL